MTCKINDGLPDAPPVVYEVESLADLWPRLKGGDALQNDYEVPYGVGATLLIERLPDEPEAPDVPGAPFRCPNCGADDQWRAEYYEATYQGCVVSTGENGEPVVDYYQGVYGHFDDPATEDESIRCTACDYQIVFGRFVLVEQVDDAEAESVEEESRPNLALLDPEWGADAVAELIYDTLCDRGMQPRDALAAMQARYSYDPFGRMVDYIESGE